MIAFKEYEACKLCMELLMNQYQFDQRRANAEDASHGQSRAMLSNDEENFRTPQVPTLREGFEYDANQGVRIAATPMSRDIENLVQRAATNHAPTAHTPGT